MICDIYEINEKIKEDTIKRESSRIKIKEKIDRIKNSGVIDLIKKYYTENFHDSAEDSDSNGNYFLQNYFFIRTENFCSRIPILFFECFEYCDQLINKDTDIPLRTKTKYGSEFDTIMTMDEVEEALKEILVCILNKNNEKTKIIEHIIGE